MIFYYLLETTILKYFKKPLQVARLSRNSAFEELVSKAFIKETKRMIPGLLALVIIPFQAVTAQHYTETITKEAQFQNPDNPDNRLLVYNINGSVSVEGYDGQEVKITAQKKLENIAQQKADQTLEELKFVVEENGDQVLVHLDAPFIEVKKAGGQVSYRIDDWDRDYDFVVDITIKVPSDLNLDISTINNGKVSIADVTPEELIATNVNGAVELTNISGRTQTRTVNGDIRASYTVSPSDDSSYETLNGTIEVLFPENLSADIRFKSFHGDLYSNFENIKRLSSEIATSKEDDGNSTAYRINKFSPIRIGNGGPTFSFEVLNGDVYIKQIES